MSTTHWEVLTPADEAADTAQDAAVSLSAKGRYLAYFEDRRLPRIAAHHQIAIASVGGVVAGVLLHYLGM